MEINVTYAGKVTNGGLSSMRSHVIYARARHL
jgi:hypothetical protein